MKLATRLITGSGAVLMVFVVLTVTNILAVAHFRAVDGGVSASLAEIDVLRALRLALSREQAALDVYLDRFGDDAKKQFEITGKKQIEVSLRALDGLPRDGVISDGLAKLPAAIAAWQTLAESDIAAMVRQTETQTNFAKVINAIDEMSTKQLAHIRELQQTKSAATRLMDWAAIAGLFGAVLAVIVTSVWQILTIRKPLSSLETDMLRIAEGDLSASITGIHRRDEIGGMARALSAFRQAAIEKQQLEIRTLEQGQRADLERRQTAEADHQALQSIRLVVETLGTALKGLALGDLTMHLRHPYASEFEDIRLNFNAAIGQLRTAMSAIVSDAAQIRTGTQEIATASDDLSQRTEQQAASLEETAAALSMIMGTVETMASNAHKATSVVLATRQAATSSGTIVQEAVNAMGQIKQSSAQINNIISVVDEIAFQTNLLALNAGVEAARAGDAGRGFAVVASEVRGLAQRSAEAAKEIKSLIAASTQKVETGVDLVGRTGLALEDMGLRVTEIDQLMRQIADAAKEQATGLAEINVAVGQMDQIVQKNAAMVEETTAAAHVLNSEMEHLAQMVGRFEIGNVAGAGGTGVHAAAA